MDILDIVFEFLQFFSFFSAFVFGFYKFFKKSVALYYKIITCSLGCYALGKLYSIIYLLCFDEIIEGFHVGYLGLFGYFIFIISANYGQNGNLIDEKTSYSNSKKGYIICLSIPTILSILFIMMMISCDVIYQRIILLVLIPSIISCYYCMKIIVLSNNELEFLHEIRLCNIFIILSYICFFAYILASFKSYSAIKQSFEVLISFLGWLIMLAAYKGAKTWKI